jgi:hypothetical protein
MSDLHIDDFYKDAAQVLLVLYRHFPRPYTLYVEDLIGLDQVDEYGLHSDRHMGCFGAMIWLRDAGLLRFIDVINNDAIDQAVLTHKALTLLTSHSEVVTSPIPDDAPPSVLDEHSSNIHQLRMAIRSGASFSVRRIMQHLLTEAKKH